MSKPVELCIRQQGLRLSRQRHGPRDGGGWRTTVASPLVSSVAIARGSAGHVAQRTHRVDAGLASSRLLPMSLPHDSQAP